MWREVPRAIGIIVAIFALVVATVITIDRRQMQKHMLPRNVTTLAQFARSMPPPADIRLIRHNQQIYIDVTGPLEGLPAMPSGHPMYIFDANGDIVEWTLDSGDDDAFMARWGLTTTNNTVIRPLTMPQALAYAKNTPKARKPVSRARQHGAGIWSAGILPAWAYAYRWYMNRG